MANVIIIGCLATLGVIIVILLLLAGGYLWWRHKRSQLKFIEPHEDEESTSGSLRLQQLQQMQQFETQQPPQQEFSQQSSKSPVQSQSQQQLQQTTNNINRKLNGFLNLKTPLIGSSSQTKSPVGSSSGDRNGDGGRQNVGGPKQDNQTKQILIVILASNIWSSHGQNVNPQNDDAADYVNAGGGGGGGSGSNSAERDRVQSSGEVMASRLPVLNENEPSCEELKAMWRFSRRQSRTSEMSNELPTYRDPFKQNVWDPYYPTMRTVNRERAQPRYFGSRLPMQPTYGTINYKAPEKMRLPVGRTRSFNYNDLSRIYSKTEIQKPGREPYNWAAAAIANRNNNNNDTSSRRRTQFRTGGRVQTHNVPLNSILTPQKGSFQRLKEMIWNERARELAQQRRNEEMIARAAVLKELTNGQRYKRSIFNY